MLTRAIDTSLLASVAEIDLAAIPACEDAHMEFIEKEWEYCTVYVAARYADFVGRAFLSRTSFVNQEAFERSAMYEPLVQAAVLDLAENITKSLIALELVITS